MQKAGFQHWERAANLTKWTDDTEDNLLYLQKRTDIISLFHFLRHKQNGLLSFPLTKYESKPKWTDLINTSKRTLHTDSNRNLRYGLLTLLHIPWTLTGKLRTVLKGYCLCYIWEYFFLLERSRLFLSQIRMISLANLYFDEFFLKTKHTDKTFAVNILSTPMNTCNTHSTSALLVQAIRLIWFL